MTTQAEGAFGDHPLWGNLYIVLDKHIVDPVWKPRRQKYILLKQKSLTKICFTLDSSIWVLNCEAQFPSLHVVNIPNYVNAKFGILFIGRAIRKANFAASWLLKY
jgi:hypothetical protein